MLVSRPTVCVIIMATVNKEWHIIPNAIDKKTCKKIIALGDEGFEPGMVGENESGTVRLAKNIRSSDIKFLEQHRWVTQLLVPYLEKANINAGWLYDIIGVGSLQLTRYTKGGYYNWHCDGESDHIAAKRYGPGDDTNKYIRKLSITVLLNDNYEGGQFQFASYYNTQCTISTPEFNKRGSIIVFPSFMDHRVTAVTKGIRYSLVAWFLGPPLR